MKYGTEAIENYMCYSERIATANFFFFMELNHFIVNTLVLGIVLLFSNFFVRFNPNANLNPSGKDGQKFLKDQQKKVYKNIDKFCLTKEEAEKIYKDETLETNDKLRDMNHEDETKLVVLDEQNP